MSCTFWQMRRRIAAAEKADAEKAQVKPAPVEKAVETVDKPKARKKRVQNNDD